MVIKQSNPKLDVGKLLDGICCNCNDFVSSRIIKKGTSVNS